MLRLARATNQVVAQQVLQTGFRLTMICKYLTPCCGGSDTKITQRWGGGLTRFEIGEARLALRTKVGGLVIVVSVCSSDNTAAVIQTVGVNFLFETTQGPSGKYSVMLRARQTVLTTIWVMVDLKHDDPFMPVSRMRGRFI